MNATLIERKVRLPKAVSENSLEFDVEYHGRSVVVVRAHGEANCDRADDLNEQLRSSLTPNCQFAILDLAGVSGVGPMALQTLAEFSRDFGRQGGEVWLTGLLPAAWFALHAAELNRLFTIRTSLSQALGS